MKVPNADDLLCIAAYFRDRLNPQLFNYALSVALMHRYSKRIDTHKPNLPLFASIFPSKFLPPRALNRAREEMAVLSEGLQRPVTF